MKFSKMHGLGNDYIYFDCLAGATVPNPAATAIRLSDRHCGIGGDGIVLILPDAEADCRMRMFNADGSEAEMCGNAIRCVGKFVYEHGYDRKASLRVRTGAGILSLGLEVLDGRVERVRVDMGAPILEGPRIPVAVDRNPVRDHELAVGDRTFRITCVSMGNPHCVIFVPELTDELVLDYGPQLEVHPLFPNRINVEFVVVRSRSEVAMRVWERGSGETMACGTGASAVGVAAALNGLTDRRVTVKLTGGDLEIEWGCDDHVYMTGPAAHVFDGEVEL